MKSFFAACAKSTGTTMISVLAFCAFLGCLGDFGVALLDGKPETVPDADKLYVAGLAFLNALGFFVARDSYRSSQDVGIR
jgi:hypothetical protein